MEKKNKFIILFVLLMFLFSRNAYATTVTAQKNNWNTGEIYKVQDGTATNTHLRKIWIDSGTPAFCVDYGAHIPEGTANVNQIDFVTYFSRGMSETAAKELEKKLNEYLYFGYGSSGRTTEKYFFATQKLVWETINSTGFYKSNDYTTRVGTTNFSTVDFMIKNGSSIDLSEELNSINKSINDYYIKPSMCSSNSKLELTVNESKTFTDTNNVLSQYQVTCGSGLNCETNGNTLKVTALSSGNNQTITFTKNGSGTSAILYENPVKDDTNKENQKIISGGSVGPVSCNFGIDTYQNVQTGNNMIIIFGVVGIVSIIVASIIYYRKIEISKNESV